MVHPDDLSRMALTLADSFSDPGAPKSLEFRLRVRDGSWHHLEGYWHAVPGEDGVLVAVANWRDVTERGEAEERLLKVNRSLKTLIGANNALVRAKSEQSLLDMVCKVVVESGA